MRTDAKIGSAIFGVLLLVLLIYVIAVPKHPKASALKQPSGVTPAARDADPAPVSIPPDPVPVVPVAPVPPAPLIAGATPPTEPLMGRTTTPPPTGGTPLTDSTFHPAGPADLAHDPMAFGGGTAPSPLVDTTHAAPGRHGSHPSSPAVAVGSPNQHTIHANETLSSISVDVYGNAKYWTRIADANPTLDPNRLKVGSVLSVPAADPAVRLASSEVVADSAAVGPNAYKVQAGDSLYRISKKLYGTSRRADEIYHLNEKAIGPDEARLKVGAVLQLPEPATAAHADRMATVEH